MQLNTKATLGSVSQFTKLSRYRVTCKATANMHRGWIIKIKNLNKLFRIATYPKAKLKIIVLVSPFLFTYLN